MGLGRFGGGVDTARFAATRNAKVIITDLARPDRLKDSIEQLAGLGDIEFHLGGHEPADFQRADVVVANPAVPPDNEFLRIARRHDALVTSSVNIFFELCPATIIGITGANGKSTTAALAAHMLENCLRREPGTTAGIGSVWLSGNIGGRPLLENLDRITGDDLVVLELSSFQLEQLAQIRKAPHIALLTNLTPNHLDRHGSFEAYCAAKENIFRFQKQQGDSPAVSIFNADDPVGAEWFQRYSSEPGRICIKFSADQVPPELRRRFALPGRANLQNLAAALAVVGYFGISDEAVGQTLPAFKALPHRLELVAEIGAVCWYNDSISTTPQSTIAAIEAFEQPIIIIAGGYDKNLPFDELGRKIAAGTKAAILIGQTARKIESAIRSARAAALPLHPGPGATRPGYSEPDRRCAKCDTRIEMAGSLAEAVALAREIAVPGDIVLLSPACASYDMFENFEHRGREFVRLVRSTVH